MKALDHVWMLLTHAVVLRLQDVVYSTIRLKHGAGWTLDKATCVCSQSVENSLFMCFSFMCAVPAWCAECVLYNMKSSSTDYPSSVSCWAAQYWVCLWGELSFSSIFLMNLSDCKLLALVVVSRADLLVWLWSGPSMLHKQSCWEICEVTRHINGDSSDSLQDEWRGWRSNVTCSDEWRNYLH